MARLVPVELPIRPTPLPAAVRRLLDDADDRVERFAQDHRDRPVPAFVPCDFVAAHHALAAVQSLSLAAGGRFAEWGSGVGTVTCLASLSGFDAVGIEIEPDLVEVAEALADDHAIEVEFVRGSFVPEGGDDVLDEHAYDLDREVTWLRTDLGSGGDAYDQLGLDPDDFDVVFAYPWPGEEAVVFDLFAEFAAVGALLLTHHGEDGMRLQRKVR
ncbi:MAG: hypothetical protein AAF805_07145 [Planctomycetota bacterium]